MPENAGGAAKPKNKMLPILIVLILAVVAFGAYYFFFRKTDEEPTATLSTYQELEETVYYSPGDYFVTNITGSQALAKTSVSLALTADESEFLGNNNAVVRNSIVKVLISHPEQEMRAANAIDMLENEMAVAIRSATGLECLSRVYISDFVIQ